MLSNIRELIFDKDGDFSIELLKGADENFEVEQRIFEELASSLKGAELPYYTARLHQAFCEYNLGNVDVAKKICEEIITWGNAQTGLKNDSNFCSLFEIMKLRLDDKDYRRAYELCQKLDLSNELYLLQMVAVSTDVISSNLSSERWKDALTVAQILA